MIRMRWYVLLFFFLIVIVSVNSQSESVCTQQGGECKSVCGTNEAVLDLTEQCTGGLTCCVSSIQSLNNPSTSSTCSDGTPYSGCSDFFSGGFGRPNYCDNGQLTPLCSICGCPEGSSCSGTICLSEDGRESSDISLVNSPPIISIIPILSTPFDPIDLNLYAEDPEGNILSFTFSNGLTEYSSNVLDCSITESTFFCVAKGTGPDAVDIVASDGEKTNEMIFSIEAIRQETISLQENTFPVANAGKDTVVLIGQDVVLDASQSYDVDGNLPSLNDAFIWKERGMIIGKGRILKTKFTTSGTHIVTLEVTDLAGSTSKDSVTMRVREKSNCVNTNAVYYPQDTQCTKKWPSKEGELIAINSESYSCDLFEVCDGGLDHIIEEAIDCCDGTPFLDSKRSGSCAFANRNSGGNVNACQALYVIKGFGDGAVYMQDYFYSEMCCYGIRELCPAGFPLYTPRPLPLTDTNPTSLQCRTSADNRILGEWVSDTRIDLNNIALQDTHTGATVNVLSTGTCVDYNAATVTLLRKLGFKSTDVFLVEATNHAYALVKLPLDRKYTFLDTTGNSEPISIGGLPPQNYPYCENMLNCYNDMGRAICPELKDIKGCSGVKESILKQSSRIGFKTKKIGEDVFGRLLEEARR